MSSILLERVGSHIASLGYGTLGVDLFVGTLNTTPYLATGVFATGGFSRAREPVLRPSFQIAHRNTNIASGTSRVTSLSAALSNGNSLMCPMPGFFELQSDPGPHYRDSNGHFVFTLNFVYTTTKLK